MFCTQLIHRFSKNCTRTGLIMLFPKEWLEEVNRFCKVVKLVNINYRPQPNSKFILIKNINKSYTHQHDLTSIDFIRIDRQWFYFIFFCLAWVDSGFSLYFLFYLFFSNYYFYLAFFISSGFSPYSLYCFC